MCKRCKSSVSERYASVLWDSQEIVPACPTCDDAKIDDGTLHEYRR